MILFEYHKYYLFDDHHYLLTNEESWLYSRSKVKISEPCRMPAAPAFKIRNKK